LWQKPRRVDLYAQQVPDRIGVLSTVETMQSHPSYDSNTGCTEQDVSDAITRSISHNEIVNLGHTEGRAKFLAEACEGDIEANEAHEYWGTDCDGNSWRVHLYK
jgi:hypothetical protein